MQDPLISSAVGLNGNLNGHHEPNNASGAYGNWSPPRDTQSPYVNQPDGSGQHGYGDSGE